MTRRTIAILADRCRDFTCRCLGGFRRLTAREPPASKRETYRVGRRIPSVAGGWRTTTTGAAGIGTTNAPGGIFSALWDMNGPSGTVLSQAFTVPESETLSFAFAYDNQAGAWAQDVDPYGLGGSSNQWLRIDVLESGADPGSLDADDIVATAFDSQSGEHPFSQGWENVTVSLAGRAGDTLIFRVATLNTLFYMPVWLDGVSSSTAGRVGNRAGFCSVAGDATTERDGDPTGDVPRPGRERAVNRFALPGGDTPRTTTRISGSAATSCPVIRRRVRWSVTAATAIPAVTRTWRRTRALYPAEHRGRADPMRFGAPSVLLSRPRPEPETHNRGRRARILHVC